MKSLWKQAKNSLWTYHKMFMLALSNGLTC